jgi:hypothetical protein
MRVKSILSALGIACAFVIGLDYVSFAATGHSLILGQLNQANAKTVIQRTNNGPAAGFVTRPGQAPFTVNRTTKVANLNADLVDGRHASSFANNNTLHVYRFTVAQGSAASSHTFNVPGTLPSGKYLATYSVTAAGLAGTAAAPVNLFCEFTQTVGSTDHDTVFGTAVAISTTNVGVNGTGLVDTANGNTLHLICISSASTWYTPAAVSIFGINFDAMPAEITLTKIDSSSVGTGTVSRVVAPH